MVELKLTDIRSPKEFQNFCEELLCAEYSDFRAIDDTMGDQGCDGRADKNNAFFQMYFPSFEENYTRRMNKIKDKIRKSLQKVQQPHPKKWILIIPIDPAPSVQKLAMNLEGKYYPMQILIWSVSKLNELLAKHTHVRDSWIEKISGPSNSVLPPESLTYAKRNNLNALLEIDKKIGKSIEPWSLAGLYNQKHTIISGGQSKIELIPSSKETAESNPIVGNFEIKFDKSIEGKKKLQEFLQFEKKGYPVEFDSRFITKAEIKIKNTDFYLVPSSEKIGKLEIIPEQKLLDVNLDIVYRGKVVDRIQNIEFKIIRSGTEEIEMNNFHQNNQSLKIYFFSNLLTKIANIQIRIDGTNLDALDGFIFCNKMLNFCKSDVLQIKFRKSHKLFEYKKRKLNSTSLQNTLEDCRKLKAIQEKTKQFVPSIIEQNVDQSDLGGIDYAYNAVTKGTATRKYGEISFTIGNLNLDFINDLLNGKGLYFRILFDPIKLTIFSKEIDLGKATSYFRGRLKEDLIGEVRKRIQSNEPNGIKIIIVPTDNDELVVDYFHQYSRQKEKFATNPGRVSVIK